MSAFGYGSTYMPSWREQQTASNNAQQNPAFNIAPAMAQPNFQPTMGNPWGTPQARDVGDWEYSTGGNGFFDSGHSGSKGDAYKTDNWANPLEATFGPMGIFTDHDKIRQFGDDVTGQEVNYWGYEGGGSNRGFSNGMRNTYANTAPADTKALLDKVNGLSMDQLMRASSYAPQLSSMFGTIAQDYTNAYGNSQYGKRLTGMDAGGLNTIGKDKTMDYLQQSYDQLLGKMNSNYLL